MRAALDDMDLLTSPNPTPQGDGTVLKLWRALSSIIELLLSHSLPQTLSRAFSVIAVRRTGRGHVVSNLRPDRMRPC